MREIFITMKTLPILAFLAALVALVISPLSFELVTSLAVVAGLVAIAIADYSLRVRTFDRRVVPVRSAVVLSHPTYRRVSVSALELAA